MCIYRVGVVCWLHLSALVEVGPVIRQCVRLLAQPQIMHWLFSCVHVTQGSPNNAPVARVDLYTVELTGVALQAVDDSCVVASRPT